MLTVDDCWGKINEIQVTDGNEHLINLQTIKEKLLRLTTKWTDCYATDILIFIDSMPQYFLKDEIVEVDLYFRNMGVNWIVKSKDGNEREVSSALKHYIGKAKITFKDNSMTLYWQIGNY